ncbi:endonuclease/exonuclease/phosphatase family protein [Petrimonas mucosa]|jgi:endonuclease/exonuclease/phosphatase family metal-dependent hydrolase|uniref:endonuclease/exonuclease/phosphatase family protein n=1 Tax=Petrimonas mucosa TaxID=1642646 RepID=UPI001759B4B1|nr:endonuclease/exonuclease/phosphatase family protein [Petrimonas mucosa]HHT29347.1 endonuclease/exonuclease/phosphatase family protein [Petrimonas mucosa]
MKKVMLFALGLCLTLSPIFAGKPSGKELIIASYNLRMDTPSDGENSWSHRKEMVKELIRFYDFDIVGTQEGFKHMLNDILELGNYAYVGVGRDDGQDAGEHSAILYRKDRFEVLESGNFWYSETPEVPGKGWDAVCCNRICSWAKFKERRTGTSFFVFNSHFDHQGKEARKNSSLLLIRKIKEIAGDATVFVTGDFNAVPDAEPIRLIHESGLLLDSYEVTEEPPYGTVGTFNSYRLDSPVKNRIDYIWVTHNVKVKKYGVLNDLPYFRFPSDHFPVMIKAEIPKKK